MIPSHRPRKLPRDRALRSIYYVLCDDMPNYCSYTNHIFFFLPRNKRTRGAQQETKLRRWGEEDRGGQRSETKFPNRAMVKPPTPSPNCAYCRRSRIEPVGYGQGCHVRANIVHASPPPSLLTHLTYRIVPSDNT